MTVAIYEFIPGSVAALLYVRKNPMTGCTSAPVVFMSKDKGAVWGRRETPLAEAGWPDEVKTEINRHFERVFDLEHETWPGPGPSPRAQYCDAAVIWQIQVDEPDQTLS